MIGVPKCECTSNRKWVQQVLFMCVTITVEDYAMNLKKIKGMWEEQKEEDRSLQMM